MAKVDSFLLQKPKDYVEFRKNVLNIIDWGKDKRLKEIRKSLDSLLEENRKIASQLAKSRPPPSDDSASSSSKRKDWEYSDQFISAPNERARSKNTEPSPLDSSNYNDVSDTDAYPAEESQTSVDEPAAASFSYLVEEPEAPDDEFANSFSYPAATSFSYRESDYNDLAEEPEASADEVPTYIRSTRSKKGPSKESEKIAPKDTRHSTRTSRPNHRPKK